MLEKRGRTGTSVKESLRRLAEAALRDLGIGVAVEIEKKYRDRLDTQAQRLYQRLTVVLNEEQPDIEMAVFVLEQLKLTVMNEWRKDNVISRGKIPIEFVPKPEVPHTHEGEPAPLAAAPVVKVR